MDRRMYRGNMGNRYNTPYKPCNPGCGDAAGGYVPENNCERDKFDDALEGLPIAMCYVPWQRFRNLYENEFAALENGTLFKELDLDWYGRGCK